MTLSIFPKVLPGAAVVSTSPPSGTAPCAREGEASTFERTRPRPPSRDISQPALFADISETFPVCDLSRIGGHGRDGDKFLLDGGSLQGLALNVRRVDEGGRPGMELQLKILPSKLAALVERMDRARAKRSGVSFRSVDLGAGGEASYASRTVTLQASAKTAPNTLPRVEEWARRLEDASGASVELATGSAAKAVRGLMRIRLVGSDAECQKQLQSFIKQLGLEQMFAPPTSVSKQRLKLMRALWQADHEAAEKLSARDLDTIAISEIEARLKHVGYDDARISKLTWSEVCPGHFTALDPVQLEQMVDAGARYLYASVLHPERVLDVLSTGQRSSLERYRKGLFADGLSTMTDFSTGGAVGVFVRLVTQQAILDRQEWAGKRYYVVLKAEQLARTDWYGWSTDTYGQSYGLCSDKNFGARFVEEVQKGGSYSGANELVFRSGNRPEDFLCVVARTEEDRGDLIALMHERGFVPPDGKAIEDFVRVSSTFLQLGPIPYDLSDLPGWVDDACAKAKAQDTTRLRWLLAHAPIDRAQRAEIERRLLTSGDPVLLAILTAALERTGQLALELRELEALLEHLPPEQRTDFLCRVAPALLGRDDDAMAARLAPMKARLSRNAELCEELLRALDEKRGSGPASPSLLLLLDIAAPAALLKRSGVVLRLLQALKPLQVEDPVAFVAQALMSGESSRDEALLRLVAQSEAEELAPIVRALLATKDWRVEDALALAAAKSPLLGLPPAELAAAIEEAPGACGRFLAHTCLEPLLLCADPQVVSFLCRGVALKTWLPADRLAQVLYRLLPSGEPLGEAAALVFAAVLPRLLFQSELIFSPAGALNRVSFPLSADPRAALEEALAAAKAGDALAVLRLYWFLVKDPPPLPVAEVQFAVLRAGLSTSPGALATYFNGIVANAPRSIATVVADAWVDAAAELTSKTASAYVELLTTRLLEPALLSENPAIAVLLTNAPHRFSLHSDFTRILRTLDAQTSDGARAIRQALEPHVRLFAERLDAKTIAYLEERAKTPAALGLSVERRVQLLAESFPPGLSPLQLPMLSPGVIWLLKAPDGSLDTQVMDGFLASLSAAFELPEKAAILTLILTRVAERVPAAWRRQVLKAQKTLLDFA